MSLSPRLIAIQGIGFTPIAMAVQGLLDAGSTEQPKRPQAVPAGGFGTALASGPDALLSMADYLRRFGKTAEFQATAVAAKPATIRQSEHKKRQRMEEEIFALMDF